MPSLITGVYKLKWQDDMLAMVRGLDGTEEMLKASRDGEQNWFQVTDHGDDTFTIHIGHAWNSFTIDKEFEHDFQGGASGVTGKCKSILTRPSENVLDKICNLPNGKAYRSILNFSEEGINADVSVGDIKGKRFFERVHDSFITGKYKMLREDSVLEVVKGLDATPDMIKANQTKEQSSLQITDNKDGTFTMHIGHAKNTFKIDEWFEHSFQGGSSNVKGNCRSILRKPDQNTLDKICNLPNGKAYRSIMYYGPTGMMAVTSVGDIVGKRYYERLE